LCGFRHYLLDIASSLSGAVARKESNLERTYQSAMALVSRADGPLAKHLQPWVTSLINKQYVAAVVYVKARHAAAFDRWLAVRQSDLADLSEIHLTQC
jgi:hypothetical protein